MYHSLLKVLIPLFKVTRYINKSVLVQEKEFAKIFFSRMDVQPRKRAKGSNASKTKMMNRYKKSLKQLKKISQDFKDHSRKATFSIRRAHTRHLEKFVSSKSDCYHPMSVRSLRDILTRTSYSSTAMKNYPRLVQDITDSNLHRITRQGKVQDLPLTFLFSGQGSFEYKDEDNAVLVARLNSFLSVDITKKLECCLEQLFKDYPFEKLEKGIQMNITKVHHFF